MAETGLAGRLASPSGPAIALPFETIEAAEAGVTEDCAVMLYAYGRNGVLVTFFASVFLVAMVYTPGLQRLQFAWLGCILLVVALRGLDLLVLHPCRRARGMDAAAEIRLFAVGTIVAGLIWAAFPIVFYPMISLTERAASAIVLCALAGGSATVLSPSLPLAIAYGTLLLVPPSIMMFLIPGRENVFLGVLGLAMHLFLSISSRVANRSLVNALRLSRANERLRASAEIQRLQTQAINAQLETVQTALRDANLSLEDRIAARTADLAHEVAERKRYAEALARLASIDPLTGLCNRSTFAEKLACMLADAEAKQTGLAVLFLDLDNFKQVNDVRGHAVGDKVLQRAAGLLNQTAGEGVLIARWGGDEFVMALLIEQNSSDAMALGERVRQSFGEPLKAGLESINLDVTIGVAMFPGDGRSQDRLIRAADLAMCEAKREGKGRLKLFDPALASNMAERHALEQALRHAIARNEFALAFQPIISVQTGACDAFEALLRWNHHELGAVGPGTFIPIAEQSGQIFSIGRWVLRQACRAGGGPAAGGDAGCQTTRGHCQRVRGTGAIGNLARRCGGRAQRQRPRPVAAADRDHREHVRQRSCARDPDLRGAPGPGHTHPAGRFRDRLLLPGVPGQAADRRHQDRPEFRARGGARRLRGDRRHPVRRPRAEPAGHRGGRRDHGAATGIVQPRCGTSARLPDQPPDRRAIGPCLARDGVLLDVRNRHRPGRMNAADGP